jgi:hypothetical protein
MSLRFDIFAMLVLTTHLTIRLLEHLLRSAENSRFIVGLLADLFNLLSDALRVEPKLLLIVERGFRSRRAMSSGELIVDERAAVGLILGVLSRSLVLVVVSHVQSPRSSQAVRLPEFVGLVGIVASNRWPRQCRHAALPDASMG